NFHFLFPPRLSCFDALVFCTPPRFPQTCGAALPSPDLPFSPANPSIEGLPSPFQYALLSRFSPRPAPLPLALTTAARFRSPSLWALFPLSAPYYRIPKMPVAPIQSACTLVLHTFLLSAPLRLGKA